MLESKINQAAETKLTSIRRAENNKPAKSCSVQQQLIFLQRSIGNRNTVRWCAAMANASGPIAARLLFKHPLGSSAGSVLMRNEAGGSGLSQLRSHTSTPSFDRSRCLRLIRQLDPQERQLLHADRNYRDLLARVLLAFNVAQLLEAMEILQIPLSGRVHWLGESQQLRRVSSAHWNGLFIRASDAQAEELLDEYGEVIRNHRNLCAAFIHWFPQVVVADAANRGETWRAAMQEWSLLGDFLQRCAPVENSAQRRGILNLFGQGTGLSREVLNRAFQILYPSINLLSEGTEFSSPRGRLNYTVVEPHTDTLRRFILYLAELPHSHLAGLIMAFAHRYTFVRDDGETEVRQAHSRTVFRARPFSHEVIVFGTDARGRAIDPAVRTLQAGIPFAVGAPGTTPEPHSYFRASVRHEVGEVVGLRIRVPYRGREITGVEFVRTWSGWRDEQQSAFIHAMWNYQQSVNTGLFHEVGGVREIIYAPSREARQWFMWVLISGHEPPQREWNNIEFQSELSLDEKLRVLGESAIGNQPLVKYVSAIRNNAADASRIPHQSNLFAGWQPSGIRGSRIFLKQPRTQGFVSIRIEAFWELERSHGLYSLNSLGDMFAEMYNGWHGGVITPRAIQVGGENYDPEEFFLLLQQQ